MRGLAALWLSLALMPSPAGVLARQPETTLAIVNVGGVDSTLFQRVVDHVRRHLRTEPRLLPPQRPAGAPDLEGEAEALVDLRPEQSLALVGVVRPAAGVDQHGYVNPEKGVGVINAEALRPGDGDTERHARRLEKETIRAFGLLLGLTPVPIPYSAMYPYPDENMLDAKARELDPPSLIQFQRIARERGLQGYTD